MIRASLVRLFFIQTRHRGSEPMAMCTVAVAMQPLKARSPDVILNFGGFSLFNAY